MIDEMSLAANLMETRDGMRKLFGNSYPARVRPYKDAILEQIQSSGQKVILVAMMSVIEALKQATRAGLNTELDQMLFLAAGVELIAERLDAKSCGATG